MAVEIAPKGKKATITFTTPLKDGASQAILTGEWDNWEVWVMKKNKNGTFSIKINIDLGKAYQFGYSIDGRWNPDTDLTLVASPFGTSNSVLDLTKIAIVEKEETAVKPTASKPAAKSPAKKTSGK
ncbi:MAG: hypothetical protein LBH98_05065 [Chitinispirillales bacterium]|jgi:1,4-alpha-glucan branching enzyme|nr:hypothetical protein [Chitinispirillales bacterium]